MTQVLAGLAAGVWVYPALVQWAVWRWLSAAAALPAMAGAAVLTDAGLASAVSSTAVGAAVALACWRARPTPATLGAVGGLALLGVAGWFLLGGPDEATTLDLSSSTGLLLVVIPVVVALVAASGAGRAGASSMRLVCLLPAVVSALAIAGDNWLIPLAWCPAAGALGLVALARGRRSSAAALAQTDAVDEAALAAFTREHGDAAMGPVVVVIAAYNEAAGLPSVLATVPRQVLGLRADVLVVDDGSTDGTAESAQVALTSIGGYLAACPVNRGQGAALRLGYRIGREHGAQYVVTLDADGQYAAEDIAGVLAPVVEGRADFVTGSRLLGRQHTRDRVRRLGVHVFGWLASALLGRRLTDTSFGLRAMRAEVTQTVTLNQPQYQASELLVGVVSHGYRVLEVPATMHERSSGSTKKGRNLVYGARYARVMLGTWWREGCPSPVAESAPALGGSTGYVPADVIA